MASTKNSNPARTRGRPALSDAAMEDMRRHITACALRLFQEEGYNAISMRRLASEAGCTVMTLYRYYDRKIDILRHVWSEVFSSLFDELDEIAKQTPDSIARLHAVALGYVNFWLKRRDHYFLVFMSSDVSQKDVSVFVDNDDVVDRFTLFQDSLSAATGSTLSAEETTLKTQVLLCGLNGVAHNLITIGGYPWADGETLVRAMVSGLLKA